MSVVLHTLRCIGTTGEERLAGAAGMSAAAVEGELAVLSESGLATRDPGPFGGWSITDTGRQQDDESLRLELLTGEIREGVIEAYEGFLMLNPVLLGVCSDWQMRRVGSSPVLNDHRDTDYDVSVLDRLGRVHDHVVPILQDLSGVLDRFSEYESRFETALQRAMGGRVEAVADSLDSYHAVWFQLHEDLLITLGLSREDEQRGFAGDGSGQPG